MLYGTGNTLFHRLLPVSHRALLSGGLWFKLGLSGPGPLLEPIGTWSAVSPPALSSRMPDYLGCALFFDSLWSHRCDLLAISSI